MVFRLDHVIIAVHDLDAATRDYQTLGFTVVYGGRHLSGSTHNALIYFADGTYLELLAPTGEQSASNSTNYVTLVDGQEGVIGYCLGSDNLPAAVQAMRERGVRINDPQQGGRARPDGQMLRWQTAMLPVEDYPTDAITPFFIADETPRRLRVSDEPLQVTHANGITGVIALEMISRNSEKEIMRHEHLLGITSERDEDSRCETFRLGEIQLRIPLSLSDADQMRLATHNRILSQLMFKTGAVYSAKYPDKGWIQYLDASRTHGAILAVVNSAPTP